MEHTTVALWGDFAENEGAFLEKLQNDKSILALCDVRVSIYKGIYSVFYVFIKYKLNIVDVRVSIYKGRYIMAFANMFNTITSTTLPHYQV